MEYIAVFKTFKTLYEPCTCSPSLENVSASSYSSSTEHQPSVEARCSHRAPSPPVASQTNYDVSTRHTDVMKTPLIISRCDS